MTEARESTPGLIGLRCAEVADAVFPHYFDRDRRSKLALALVALAEAIADRATDALPPHPRRRRDERDQ